MIGKREKAPRRKACACPATCWGPAAEQHSISCRPGRPLCRWRRKDTPLCHCDKYPYPHRDNSGVCNDDAAYLAMLMKPRNRYAA